MRTTRLTKIGNSTGVTPPRDVLAEAGLDRGDAVTVTARDGRIEIAKAGSVYGRAMEAGRASSARYRRTMADRAS